MMTYALGPVAQSGTNAEQEQGEGTFILNPNVCGERDPRISERYTAPSAETQVVLRVDLTHLESGQVTSVSLGRQDFGLLREKLIGLMKIERQRQDRIAAVQLDPVAPRILAVLDDRTSIRWDALRMQIGLGWEDICRGIALLAGANLCDAGPSRLRLSEAGVTLLAQEKK